MARPLLPLLCGIIALLLPWAAAGTARCSHPKDVANAHIDVGNNTELNAQLRYTCNVGYKRKAGTSGLIQCILNNSREAKWTSPTLQCIRDLALPPQTPSPELPATPHGERTTQRGTSDASPTKRPPPEPSMLPETSTPGEGTARGTSLGTTPLPIAPTDHAAVSIQTLASSIGLPVLVVAGVVACCCWRMKMRTGQPYVGAATSIPMVAPAAEEEPPSIFPTG
ncbi:interleukin-15 receptor subunit alpha [Aegotheles albertisi]